jgi:phage protein D
MLIVPSGNYHRLRPRGIYRSVSNGSLDSLLLAARTATPVITYNGADQSTVVYPSLLELSVKEGIGFTGDAVTLRLADPEGLFRLTWTLKAVVPLDLTIKTQNWNYPGEMLTRDFGTFTVTRCEISQNKGQGTVVSLYASSINPCTPGRLQKNSSGTNATTLQALAAAVAQANGLTLNYIAPINPTFSRVDQYDQSDYVFLQRLCKQNDFFMKVKNGGLWIQSMTQIEQQSPAGTIICPTPGNPGGINGVGGIIS